MLRTLAVLLVFVAACGRPPSGSSRPSPAAKPSLPVEEPPPLRSFRDEFGRPRRFVPDGPLRRGPYVQAVSSGRATICFELVEAGEGKVTCDGKTVAGARGLRHELTVEGLKPATRYSYTVEPGGRTGSFKTPPDGEGDLFFVAWGDSRTYYDKLARISELVAEGPARLHGPQRRPRRLRHRG